MRLRSKHTVLLFVLTLLVGFAPSASWALGDWWDFYEKGQKLAKKGKWEEALNEYINASILDRKDRLNARIYGLNFIDYFPNREIGVAYYQLGDSKQAKVYLDRSVALKNSKLARKFLARISEGSAPEGGGANFQSDSGLRIQREKQNKLTAQRLAVQSRTALQRKNPEQALDLARKAQLLDPSNRSVRSLISRGQTALKATEEAEVQRMIRAGQLKDVQKGAAMRDREAAVARRRMDAGMRLMKEAKYFDAIVEFESVSHGSDLRPEAMRQISVARQEQIKAEDSLVVAARSAKPKIRPRVAVSDFEPIGVSKPISRAVSENLRSAMIETQKYYVLERALLKKILEQQKMQLAGMTDSSQAVQIGKLMAVRYMALGSLTKLGQTLTINFRFIDVESGRAVVARNVRGKSEDELPDMIDKLVDEIQKFQL